jgi:hypothetical protein
MSAAEEHLDEAGERFLARLPAEISSGLSAAQREAISRAAADRPWSSHPVDIRVSLPLPFTRVYLTLVAGTERRNAARRAVERLRHPLIRFGNLVFGVVAMVLLYIAAMIGVLFWAHVLE